MKKAKAIMIQGTGSSVGKSLLTTALCRIFLEDGYRAAPFKVQNMALNAYVTREGLEMSRAQALQAQACRLDPDVRMNPILIKPSRKDGSEIIVMGKSMPVASWAEYTGLKPGLVPVVEKAYASLASEVDIMVLEGAGSPAEINLMEHDIVNMRAAEMADAPVLLAGDIDAGGVFAGLVGTLALLPERQASRIKGFLLNKFRGNRMILAPGLSKIEALTGRPVVGVIPFLEGLFLPEEDSVSLKCRAGAYAAKESVGQSDSKVRIAILELPRISNFTDLDPFFGEPDVEVNSVPAGKGLSALGFTPDAVVLPGSKNVAKDLDALREAGLEKEIRSYVSNGGALVGLCGGFQMMGQSIEDPFAVENSPGEDRIGLGLLDLRTVFEREKVLSQTTGVHLPSGFSVKGFEIHYGRSTAESGRQLIRGTGKAGSALLGLSDDTGKVWGTYLHGIFDSDLFRRWWIDGLREKKGLPPLKEVQVPYDLERSLSGLALSVRKELDLDLIYRLVHTGG